MSAHFHLTKSKNGQFHFSLYAANGKIILSSEMYTTKAAAENGIASVKENCAEDAHFERKIAQDGTHYFTLKALNHQVIGASQMYTTEEAREKGIEAVKHCAIEATVRDET